VGGWGLTESICHSAYCRPALNGDKGQLSNFPLAGTRSCSYLFTNGWSCYPYLLKQMQQYYEL